jgi:hypothetical protein
MKKKKKKLWERKPDPAHPETVQQLNESKIKK